MPSTFGLAVNEISTQLASPHVASDGQLVLKSGSVALIGALPAHRVYRIVALLNPGTAAESITAIFEATGATGDTLTGVTAVEGTTDVNLAANYHLQIRGTAKYMTELQAAVNTLETTVEVTAHKGVANGYASLNSSALVPASQLLPTPVVGGIVSYASNGNLFQSAANVDSNGNLILPGVILVGSNQLLIQQSGSFPSQIQFPTAVTFTSLVGFGTNATGGVSINAQGPGSDSSTFTAQHRNASGHAILLLRDDGNIAIYGEGSYGSGVGVIFLANCTTEPTTNPVGGVLIYAFNGAARVRGSSGTVTEFGPA